MNEREVLFKYNIWLQFHVDIHLDKTNGFSKSFDLHNGVVCILDQRNRCDKIFMKYLKTSKDFRIVVTKGSGHCKHKKEDTKLIKSALKYLGH